MDAPVSSPHEVEIAEHGRTRSAPAPRRILLFAFLGEGALLLIGLVWMLARDLPFAWSDASRVSLAAATAIGLLTAAGLAAIAVRAAAPRARAGTSTRAAASVSRAAVSAVPRQHADRDRDDQRARRGRRRGAVPRRDAARVGPDRHEPRLRPASTSADGSRWHLGIWAACTGALLGWLAIATGGLLAPIVAHIAYDALALSYLRWGPALPDTNDAGRVG